MKKYKYSEWNFLCIRDIKGFDNQVVTFYLEEIKVGKVLFEVHSCNITGHNLDNDQSRYSSTTTSK